jgi:hypothetical protein
MVFVEGKKYESSPGARLAVAASTFAGIERE